MYCHRAEEWPADAEVLERVPVRSCSRRGPAIDLVLDRGRETADVEATFAVAGSVPPAPPSAAAVRVWAVAVGLHVSDRGRIPAAVLAAYHGRTDAATLGWAWTGTGQAGRTWP